MGTVRGKIVPGNMCIIWKLHVTWPLEKDSATFLSLLKLLQLKKKSITAIRLLKLLTLKKGLRYFLTTFKVINAERQLHHFFKTLNPYFPSVRLNWQSLFLSQYVVLVDDKLVKLINVAYINIRMGFESKNLKKKIFGSKFTNNSANICWSWRHVLKTSWRHVW